MEWQHRLVHRRSAVFGGVGIGQLQCIGHRNCGLHICDTIDVS